MTQLIGAVEQLDFNEQGGVITTEQTLGPDYWNDIKEAVDNFKMRLDGYTPVASIPEAVVNRWLREGFDFYNAPAKEIIAKLRSENMDGMIISGDTRF